MKCIVFFSLVLFTVACETKKESINLKVISLSEITVINQNAKDYKTTIHLADSLYQLHSTNPFYIELETMSGYSDGLYLILKLYRKANTFYKSKELTNKIHRIEKEQFESTLIALNTEYQKIIDKAEEYYSDGNIEKAIELYERTIVLKPSDEKAQKRLKELKKSKRLN